MFLDTFTCMPFIVLHWRKFSIFLIILSLEVVRIIVSTRQELTDRTCVKLIRQTRVAVSWYLLSDRVCGGLFSYSYLRNTLLMGDSTEKVKRNERGVQSQQYYPYRTHGRWSWNSTQTKQKSMLVLRNGIPVYSTQRCEVITSRKLRESWLWKGYHPQKYFFSRFYLSCFYCVYVLVCM